MRKIKINFEAVFNNNDLDRFIKDVEMSKGYILETSYNHFENTACITLMVDDYDEFLLNLEKTDCTDFADIHQLKY